MAFDYGSIDLGLKNPFKKEGAITAIRGAIQIVLGVYLLIAAVPLIKESPISGWIFVVFSGGLLTIGIRALGSGIYAMFRYYVGRNHPTSLAHNYSKSESSTAAEEKKSVAYSGQELEEMLIGRKNTTFVEPKGFLARLLHSLVPKLLFMPYLIRNLIQKLFGAWIKTVAALVAYAVVAFISLTGLAGSVGELAFPVYSVILLLYVISVWVQVSRGLSRQADKEVESLGSGAIVKIVIWSVLLPVGVAALIGWTLSNINMSERQLADIMAHLPSLHTYAYLIGLFIISTIGTGIVLVMLSKRLAHANPVTEVSELRENWQESVHPNDIFINLENLVLANLRYKEMPNRVYHELKPILNEQVQGKGDFKGKVIQEIQPKFSPMNLGRGFSGSRMLALISGNVLFIIASIVTFLMAYAVLDTFNIYQNMRITNLDRFFRDSNFANFVDSSMWVIHLCLIGLIAKSFAQMLSKAAHIFFAELQFESLLVYFKCEGTFAESTMSTGGGIHDSTRSENRVVRSSITPWIVVSRVVSTTFAGIGMKNLEYSRHIMEMHKDDDQLAEIRADVVGFLKDRELIASITSERDIGNASQLYQLNEQMRSHGSKPALEGDDTKKSLQQDESAAGFLRNAEQLADKE
ncbi:hypothetical protein [Marinomonas colpomeniae]|uniref:Uncharacterized protein n=1 Tax=Marinomonas colpomeniae TaxID=2774408 RepID=A0ABR8NXE1_9GAMM|nr:hypothetical protein [Marinomonas colpomeniae]MBD5770705.1 hypothetical protein [Marinomonas colpomeniae]